MSRGLRTSIGTCPPDARLHGTNELQNLFDSPLKMPCCKTTRIQKSAHYQTENGVFTVLNPNDKSFIFTGGAVIAVGLVSLVVLLAVVFLNMIIKSACLRPS